MIQILNYLYKNTKLAAILGFKGGTAAYLFYNLPRFSTDLDFDLLVLDINIEEIQSLINNYVSQKYNILDQWNKRYTLLWKLSYKKHDTNIKIEISKRDASLYKYQVRNLYGNVVRVVIPEHLIVQKMIALKNRKILANRDIFDLNYFLKSNYASDIDYDVLGKVSHTNPVEFLIELKQYLINNKPKKILDGLGEVVKNDTKTWIKNELFTETINLIQMQIDSI